MEGIREMRGKNVASDVMGLLNFLKVELYVPYFHLIDLGHVVRLELSSKLKLLQPKTFNN